MKTDNVQRLRQAILVLAWIGWTAAASAQAPLTVNGVTDRTVTADLVTFQVPSSNGYSYAVTLDGARVPTDLSIAVTNVDYHELRVSRTNVNTGAISNSLVRFIVRSSERKDSEWGIAPWVPYPVINATAAELAGAQLRVWVPQDYPLGLEIPVVAWIENAQGGAVRAHALLTAPGQPSIQLRRGAGSGYLAATNPAGPLEYAAGVPGLRTNKTINLEASTSWTSVGGSLSGATVWPANSRIAVTANLTIPAGASLTIGEGTIVKLNSRINITNNGAIRINGTEARPVVFTPASRSQPWGGFFLRQNTSTLDANGTIFVASGADPSAGAGHRSEQCLFFLDLRPRLALTNCAAIDMAGQFGHCSSAMTNSSDPKWTVVNIAHSLVQHCITGGEWNGCQLKFLNSALIEVPYATPVFADNDEDGIYFMYGEYELRDSVLGWTRDDGMDAGSGNGGSVTVSNVWMESTFHEGFAWSGGGGTSGTRRGTNDHCVVINCGQGYECGWSAGGVSYSPDVFVKDSISLANGNGLRFGDNYDWSYYGFLRVTNSLILNNQHDTFGWNWQTDSGGWIYRTANMDLQNNFLTAPSSYHPNNSTWDPARDGWRLAEYMSTPPDAPVGVAFATWTNQLDMASLFKGVPVGLSCFTTNFVSVDYALLNSAGAPLAEGTLTFAPGDTIKKIYPLGFDVSTQSVIRVVLHDPVRGELTGETNFTFSGFVPAPEISCWISSALLPQSRLPEGNLVKLSSPSALPVRVGYVYLADDDPVASGTLEFAPGQTVQWIDASQAQGPSFTLVQLNLRQPQNGTLAGITRVNYGVPPLEVSFGVGASQLDLALFTNGLPVGLTRTSSAPVTVTFRCEGQGGVLTNGTLSFASGQTAQTLRLPTVNPNLYDLLRVSLVRATGAELVAPSNVFFVRTFSAPTPLLVTSSSSWRYLDTGGNAGTAWRNLAYDDSSWSNGLAQLGFNDGDEATPIRQNGTNGQPTITFYFRQKFVVPNPGLFTNLALWLLRDDGGVAYLNGSEVYRSPSMPALPTTITYQTLANAQGSSAPADNTVDRTNLSPSLLLTGTNVVAVEIHQHRSDSSDVSFAFSLTAQPTPTLPPQPVFLSSLGGQLALAWGATGFVLEQADQVTGPWSQAATTSPYLMSPTGAQKFFRLRKL